MFVVFYIGEKINDIICRYYLLCVFSYIILGLFLLVNVIFFIIFFLIKC